MPSFVLLNQNTTVILADLGGVPGACPLRDPILSFSHTLSPKSATLLYGKSWIRQWVSCQHVLITAKLTFCCCIFILIICRIIISTMSTFDWKRSHTIIRLVFLPAYWAFKLSSSLEKKSLNTLMAYCMVTWQSPGYPCGRVAVIQAAGALNCRTRQT